MSNEVPVLYGKYQLLEQLARGGMAEVYKAKAHGVEGFEKILVIKRILPELSENPRFVEMFINEAKIAVSLSHANIVQVFDLGMAEGTYFIAMEYVAGLDLAKMLKRTRKARRTLPPGLAVYVISELAKGLDYAHRRRDAEMRPLHIIHRDVSPQNVLLSYEGEVKLTDFGIAKARTVAQAVTELGVVKGKYAYMSPEQLIGGKLDERTDIFSAGTLLYEALAGKNPFQASSTYDTLQRIRGGDIPPIEDVAEGLSADIGEIVRRAMAPDPAQRYASAGDLYEDLIQYLYTTGKRVSARDLINHLASLRGEGQDKSPSIERFEDVFEVTHYDDPPAERERDRTRITRGRKPSREPRSRPAPTPRERTEWRDVTALVIRLGEDDPMRDSTLAHLIERFGGSPVKDITLESEAGNRDMLALFGHMNPDGRDTDNAARCALKIARAASAAAAEAGTSTTAAIAQNVGRVLIDLAGALVVDPAYHELFEATEALLKQTGEGQILVDADAERALRGRFRLVPAGRQADNAFLLASERSVADAYGRFIGRRDELKRIGERLALANNGQLQIIGINGEAGSGKSRLMVETMRRLGLAGHNVGLHVTSLTPQMVDVPLSAIQEMLRVVLGVDEFDPEALLRDRTTRLRALGLLSVEQAAVATALGVPTGGTRARSGHRPLKAALLRIVRKLAEDQLTIFAFDGAEYMDTESIGIVEEMLRAVSEARIGVFLCYRPGYAPRWADLPSFAEVRLGPMNDEEAARLVATRLGADEIPFELLREVATKSAGNPLYVEEYLKALRESGALEFDEGQVSYNPAVADVDVPKTLRGIVASRIAKLGPTQRYLLQVASLVGERFQPDIVALAAQEDIKTVAEALQAVDMQGIVTGHVGSEFAFAHELVQQVLVEGITLQARKEIHTAIADAVTTLYPDLVDEMAERLARHYREAGNDEQAVRHLERAVDRLEKEGALDSAIQELKDAIELFTSIAGPADRDRVMQQYERLADLYFRNRDLLEGAAMMGRAIKTAEAQRAHGYVARFCMWRGRMLVGASKVEEGRRWLDQAQHVARGLTDWKLSRDVFLATADADARSGDFEKSVGFLREALSLSRDAHDTPSELGCLLPLALTYARMGDNTAALSTLADARVIVDQKNDPLLLSQTYRLESQIHYHARNQEASASAAGKAMEVAQNAGLQYDAALNAHNMGEAYLRLGDHRRAFAALRNSYEVSSESGFTRLQMSNMRALGFIDATRFGSAEGRARVLQAIDYAEKHEFVWDVIQGKYFLAIIEQHRGEKELARTRLRDVLNLAAQHGHRNYTQDAETALRQLDSGAAIGLPQ